MLKNIKKLLKMDGQKDLVAPKQETASFFLGYKELKVGLLRLEDGRWFFEYSDEYKQQSDLPPLVDFPHVNKRYESEELWPFFALRIPSLQQPYAREIIEKNNLDETNELSISIVRLRDASRPLHPTQ